MEKWFRTRTLKRKASDASETNSNCESSVAMDIQELCKRRQVQPSH